MFLAKCSHILLFLLFIAKCNADCTVAISSLKDILPMDQNKNILYPNDINGNIVAKQGQSIFLVCPGDTIVLKKNKKKSFNVEHTQFICNNNVYVNQQINQNIDELTCDSLRPTEKLIGQCANGHTLLDIGFKFNDNTFIPQIDLCWDDVKKRALYALTIIKFVVDGCHAQAERPAFRTGAYINADLAKYYTKHFQVYNLCTAFNSMPAAITPKIVEKNLLEIGHYVAKCDLPHDAQQRLTFQYINAGPQWSSFNKGNWEMIEKQIRNYILDKKSDLLVYTGTYGTMKLNNKDFYLYDVASQIPVPKYFWKVIIKQTAAGNFGVAILGLNDIFATTVTNPCTNILPQITWLKIPKWDQVESGYVIACQVSDFARITDVQGKLPTLPVINGILN